MADKKILIVDDFRATVSQMRSLFSRTRSVVITASNASDALAVIRKERPDLVLMDLSMPGITGDECCRMIKSDRAIMNIPVIIYSTRSDAAGGKKSIEAGCDRFIVKPLRDPQALLAAVREFISIPLRNYVRVSIDVEVRYFLEGKRHSGKLVNVSKSGGFIETDSVPLPGSIINISFTIPNTAYVVESGAEVLRSIPKDLERPSSRVVPGIGFKFLKISWKGKKAIDDYINDRESKGFTVM